MWFKNIQLYRFASPWKVASTAIEKDLSTFAFHPPTSFQLQAMGWVSPREHGGLVHSVDQQFLLAFATEKKLLPTSVIKETTKARAEAAEAQQGYKPGKKQMRELKQQAIDELLPRAFNVRRTTHVWIDPLSGWLAVDTASANRADEIVSLLNKSIPELRVARVDTALSPASAMTDWLAADESPRGLSIDDEAELQNADADKATVRFLRHPLEHAEMKRHIASGKQCNKLALTWANRVTFVLTESLTLKKLALVDIHRDDEVATDAKGATDPQAAEEKFDADFALMTGELQGLIEDLIDALGGVTDKAVETATA